MKQTEEKICAQKKVARKDNTDRKRKREEKGKKEERKKERKKMLQEGRMILKRTKYKGILVFVPKTLSVSGTLISSFSILVYYIAVTYSQKGMFKAH